MRAGGGNNGESNEGFQWSGDKPESLKYTTVSPPSYDMSKKADLILPLSKYASSHTKSEISKCRFMNADQIKHY